MIYFLKNGKTVTRNYYSITDHFTRRKCGEKTRKVVQKYFVCCTQTARFHANNSCFIVRINLSLPPPPLLSRSTFAQLSYHSQTQKKFVSKKVSFTKEVIEVVEPLKIVLSLQAFEVRCNKSI